MRSPLVVAMTLLLLLSAQPAEAAPAVLAPREGDPDVPATTPPVAVLTPFENEVWSFTEGTRTRTILVPDVAWDRVVLTFEVEPATDPWDRLFGIAIDGAEVLHGATVRAPMTIHRDVTAYAAKLPRGAEVPIQLYFGTWVGRQLLTVELAFYDDPATALLVEPAHDLVVSPFTFRGLGAPGSTIMVNATFPAKAAASGIVELTVSGHGANGEFWWLNGNHQPPTFVILADGEEIGRAVAMPYVYALLGFSPMSVVTRALHGAMWWTGQQALDIAGVHTGTGEIPSYRAILDEDALARLTDNVRVEVVVEGGSGGYWPTSLSFLLDG